jgi:hypothetical protein
MCGFMYIMFLYCGECRVWFDGCVHVFLCALRRFNDLLKTMNH